jgi:hypothetical protein
VIGASRPGTAGATRACPHCKATILESSAVCPACRGHLRFDSAAQSHNIRPSTTSLKVEGAIRQPTDGSVSEYSMLLTIRNERGEEVARQLVGVGALRPGEERTFSLTVETSEAVGPRGRKH